MKQFIIGVMVLPFASFTTASFNAGFADDVTNQKQMQVAQAIQQGSHNVIDPKDQQQSRLDIEGAALGMTQTEIMRAMKERGYQTIAANSVNAAFKKPASRKPPSYLLQVTWGK